MLFIFNTEIQEIIPFVRLWYIALKPSTRLAVDAIFINMQCLQFLLHPRFKEKIPLLASPGPKLFSPKPKTKGPLG